MEDRTNHIALAVLYEFLSGNTVIDDDAREHIEVCQQCRADITLLQWLGDFGPQERQYEPPAWGLANAEKVFKLKKPGSVTIAKELVANLVFDSFSQPLPIGVRQRDLPSRQALYQAGNVLLDLKIELGDEQGLLIGQIVSDKGEVDVNGLNIEITQAGQVFGKSTTNALGEFIFQDLPKGNYELQVLLSDTMVKLPPLPLSE
jgi:hypothetical protein